MIYLQISTAQGPAECRIFARFVLKKLLAEAEARNVKAEIAGETADKHGSAVEMIKISTALCRNPFNTKLFLFRFV